MLSGLQHSLRRKIIALFALTTFLVVAAYGFLTYFSARQELEKELGKRLKAVAGAVATDLSSEYVASQIESLSGTQTHVIDRLTHDLERLRQRLDVRRIFVVDRRARSLLDTEKDIEFGQKLYEVEADQYELKQLFETKKPTSGVLFEGETGKYYKNGYAPILRQQKVVAAVGVAGSADYFELIENFATALAGIGLAAVIFAVFVGGWIGTRLSQPIEQLVQTARRFGRGELDEPVSPEARLDEQKKGDEIEFLATAMEEMRRKIRQRDQRMQMMLSGIAHEIRNPLGGMKLQCGLLEEEIRGSNSTVEERVERIENQIYYLEEVVDDFLGFATEQQIQKEFFRAEELLDEVEQLLQKDAGEKLSVELENADIEIWGSFSALKQALLNLIKNAFDVIDSENGMVSVKVSSMSQQTRLIEVVDDGPGIPEDIQDEVVEPFFTTREQGSGLGLAIVKKIVEEHGGQLRIDTPPEQGTRVAMELPFDISASGNRSSTKPEGWLG